MADLKKDTSFGRRCMKWSQQAITYLFEEIRLYQYLLLFILIILGFAMIYLILTPGSQGLGQSGIPLTKVSIGSAIYFSIVTFSTLGYGDLHPVGLSKIAACTEVLLGLAFFGVVVAKVTSRRLSYQVERLFSSQSQKHIEEYTSQFERLSADLRQVMTSLAQILQLTPGAERISTALNAAPYITKFSATLLDLRFRTRDIERYISSEAEQGDYFSIISPEAIRRLGDSIDSSLNTLGQVLVALPPDNKIAILDVNRREHIHEIIEIQKSICIIVNKKSKDPEVLACFRRLTTTCEQLPRSFFASMTETENPPNQVLTESNIQAPQAPTTKPNKAN